MIKRVEIPKQQYVRNDPAMRWDGQYVKVLDFVGTHAKVWCHALAATTLVPRHWLHDD